MPYYTRVLSKHDEFPALEELSDQLRANHPDFRLILEEGSAEEWESLLLASSDGVEVAVLERNPVFDGSIGQDEIADFLEDLSDAKPEANVGWLTEYLDEVKTIYAFQHLQGSETVDGSNALHALRTALWERGEAILQADNEGFTNEEGYHIVWQFSEGVSGPWNMAVLQDGTWMHFTMDLGDPDHRAAFVSGEAPADLPVKPSTGREQ
ncbi:hypothetical protein DYQ86_03040 [Acidobacteria bacterium AB60]|nr:hypothetical protein DYQ86_03040 [Acidobacteria bacterium AB60]